MVSTVRLPEGLEREAKIYAEALGISLNALLAVSLRDYLDRRPAAPRPAEAALGLPVVPDVQAPAALPLKPAQAAALEDPAGVEVQVPAVAPVWRAPRRPRDPCPCGSGRQWRHCHGKTE